MNRAKFALIADIIKFLTLAKFNTYEINTTQLIVSSKDEFDPAIVAKCNGVIIDPSDCDTVSNEE